MFYIVTEILFLTTPILLSLYCAVQNLILFWHHGLLFHVSFILILFQLDYKSQEIKKNNNKTYDSVVCTYYV